MSRRSGVVFSYILLVAQVVSSLLFTPYLIRSLGQAEYGLYSLVASITAYFMLLDAGVGNALVRYIAKYRVSGDMLQQRRFLGVSLAFYAFVGVVTILLGLVLRSYLPHIFGQGLTPTEIVRAGTMLRITLVNVAVTLIASAFDRTLIAYERFVVAKSLSIANLVLRVGILTFLLFLGYKAIAVVTVSLALSIGFGLISAWIVIWRLKLRPIVSGIEAAFVKEVFAYSGFIFIQMIATQINAMTDQVLLGIMTSSVVVGIYAVGAQLTTYFQTIAGSINGVLMPGVVRMVETGARPQSLLNEMVKVGRLIFMVLGIVLVGFAVSGQSFVALWAGANNSEAYWVALILMSAYILYLTQAIGSQVLWALGRHRMQALLSIGVAVANIALTVVLIRWSPLVGASIGTAVAVLVGNVLVMNVVFTRDIGVSMPDYYRGLFRGIVPSLCVAVATGILLRLLPLHGWPSVVVQILGMLLAYAVCMVRFGMNGYEKGLLVPILRRLRISS